MRCILTIALCILLSSTDTFARRCRQGLIPNGTEFGCTSCHFRASGGGERTPFGEHVRPLVGIGDCEEFWSPALAALDSDDDGRTNGEELGDPEGLWQRGLPAPGEPSEVTNPGLPDDFTRGRIEISESSLGFGETILGESSTRSVIIRNTGDGALRVSEISFSEDASEAFSLTEAFEPIDLAPEGNTTVEVAFSPTSEGALGGTLIISSDDPDTPDTEIPLTGVGLVVPAPDIELSTTTLEFGRLDVGDSTTAGFEIRNLGDMPLEVSNVALGEGSEEGFSLPPEQQLVGLIEPGASVQVTVSFAPQEAGEFEGELVILSDDPDEPSVSVALRGGSPSLGGATFDRGDANTDSQKDISDAIFVLAFLFTGGPPPLCLDSADSNDDSVVDVSDVIHYLQGVFLGGEGPLPPSGECGEDPTEDNISCDSFPPCK